MGDLKWPEPDFSFLSPRAYRKRPRSSYTSFPSSSTTAQRSNSGPPYIKTYRRRGRISPTSRKVQSAANAGLGGVVVWTSGKASSRDVTGVGDIPGDLVRVTESVEVRNCLPCVSEEEDTFSAEPEPVGPAVNGVTIGAAEERAEVGEVGFGVASSREVEIEEEVTHQVGLGIEDSVNAERSESMFTEAMEVQNVGKGHEYVGSALSIVAMGRLESGTDGSARERENGVDDTLSNRLGNVDSGITSEMENVGIVEPKLPSAIIEQGVSTVKVKVTSRRPLSAGLRAGAANIPTTVQAAAPATIPAAFPELLMENTTPPFPASKPIKRAERAGKTSWVSAFKRSNKMRYEELSHAWEELRTRTDVQWGVRPERKS